MRSCALGARSRWGAQNSRDLDASSCLAQFARCGFLNNHHHSVLPFALRFTINSSLEKLMKSYADRGVQAGSSLLQSRTLSLDADLLAPSPEDPLFATSGSQLLSPLAPPLQGSPAYSHSSVHGSPFAKAEVSIKPRRLPQLRPPTNRHSAIRVFSLPEDSLSTTGKVEVNLVQRVVSMPEQRLTSGQLAESSMSTEGFDGSMLSGGSFLSGTDTTSGIHFFSHKWCFIPYMPSPPSSPDSVLIIENNCGLSEAFLSNQSATKSASPVSEKKNAPRDEGMNILRRLIEGKQFHFSRLDHLGEVPSSTYSCAARSTFSALCAVPIVSYSGSSSGTSLRKVL